MTPPEKVIEIFGEGKTDIGVVPILVHTLCGNPADMRVKRKGTLFLQGKGLWQKVKFAKRQAVYNPRGTAGIVFVVDTEGKHKKTIGDLEKGRDAEFSEFPMAMGAAHPCIEAWLLADAKAIKKGLMLSAIPQVPDKPEDLPAPQRDRKRNPKTELAKCGSEAKAELSSAEKDQIARAMSDLKIVSERCPVGFAPFAAEVEQCIKPLFHINP